MVEGQEKMSTSSIHDDLVFIARSRGIDMDEKDFDTDLATLGLDSIDFLDFFYDIEQKYNINISHEEIHGKNTLNKVVEFLKGKMDVVEG